MSADRPPDHRLRRALQALGAVPVVMGAYGVVTGTPAIPTGGPPNASVDSDYRFLSAMYMGAGLAAWRASRRPAHETAAVRSLAALLLAGATGRVLSLRRLGRPHPVFLALLAAEVAAGLTLPMWQADVARRTPPTPTPPTPTPTPPPAP